MASYNGSAPPSGNYTQTANDDCTGVCAHTGGWWQQSAYNLTLNANASLSNAGGDFLGTASSRWRLILEEGSRIFIAGSDMTYGWYYSGYGTFEVNGTVGNPCRFGGQDNANRSLKIRMFGGQMVTYLTYEFHRSTSYDYYSYVDGYWNHVTLANTVTSTSGYSFVFVSGHFTFTECTFNITNRFQAWGTFCATIDIDTISYNMATIFSTYYGGSIILIGDDLSAVNDINQTYHAMTYIYVSKIAVSSTPADCYFSVVHPNPPSFPVELTSASRLLDRNWSPFSGGGIDGDYLYVIWKITYRNTDGSNTHVYYSKQGEAGGNNDQYHLVCAKEGYITQETDVWCAANQTYEPVLIEDTYLVDILAGVNDIKGTDFIKDTDSNINLSHKAGIKGTDVLYDKMCGSNCSLSNTIIKHNCSIELEMKSYIREIKNLKEELKSFKKKKNRK